MVKASKGGLEIRFQDDRHPMDHQEIGPLIVEKGLAGVQDRATSPLSELIEILSIDGLSTSKGVGLYWSGALGLLFCLSVMERWISP